MLKKDSKKHDTVKETGEIKWWRNRNKAFLVNQLQHRGVRLTTALIKGGKDENGEIIKKCQILKWLI